MNNFYSSSSIKLVGRRLSHFSVLDKPLDFNIGILPSHSWAVYLIIASGSSRRGLSYLRIICMNVEAWYTDNNLTFPWEFSVSRVKPLFVECFTSAHTYFGRSRNSNRLFPLNKFDWQPTIRREVGVPRLLFLWASSWLNTRPAAYLISKLLLTDWGNTRWG